jgi:hypothetical protein
MQVCLSAQAQTYFTPEPKPTPTEAEIEMSLKIQQSYTRWRNIADKWVSDAREAKTMSQLTAISKRVRQE